MLIEVVFWAGLGLIFGSFTNVLILRHGTGKTVSGRSACPSCHTTLVWYELIPVLSWIALRGRCGHCGKGISVQYPVVEALAAAGFLIVGLSPLPFFARAIGCAIVILFLAIGAYDLRHMIMPDRWVWSFNLLAFISSLLLLFSYAPEGEMLPYVMFLAAGPLVALPLFCMWFFSKGMWMGFGDVKFALGMGWLLGIGYGYLALMYAFVLGAVVGVFILLPLPRIIHILHKVGITRLGGKARGFTMKSEVPFGPFLIAGTTIVWFALIYSFAPILNFPGDLLLWS